MAVTGSTLTVLATDLLASVDSYNANDLDYTVVGSQGNQAMRAINQALQKIYSILKRNNLLEKEAVNSALSTTANQDYVDITGITDLDDIQNIYDASNNINLKKIEFDEYRRMSPDPSETTGNPTHYALRGTGRIYLYPRPDAVYTLNIFYMAFASNLTTGSSTTSLPSKLDYWLLAEARVFWQLIEDASDQSKLGSYRTVAQECREVALEDLSSEYDLVEESDSHWDQTQPQSNEFPRFDSPVGS